MIRYPASVLFSASVVALGLTFAPVTIHSNGITAKIAWAKGAGGHGGGGGQGNGHGQNDAAGTDTGGTAAADTDTTAEDPTHENTSAANKAASGAYHASDQARSSANPDHSAVAATAGQAGSNVTGKSDQGTTSGDPADGGDTTGDQGT